MQDYIAMQKLWYDVHLAQIEVVGSSELITASAKIYVCDDLIDNLIRQIERFVNGGSLGSLLGKRTERRRVDDLCCFALHAQG